MLFGRKAKAITVTERLIYILERINLSGYIEYLNNPKRLLWTNFIIGVARGIGYAIGFGLIGGLIVYIVIETGFMNSPNIREFLRKI